MSEKASSETGSCWVPVLIVFVFLIILVSPFAYHYVLAGYFERKADFGAFGDSFGALTSFFTGLAFAAMVFTLWLQTRELRLQRTELNETKHALADQASAVRQQLVLAARTAHLNSIVAKREAAIQALNFDKSVLSKKVDLELADKIGDLQRDVLASCDLLSVESLNIQTEVDK